MGSSAHVFAFFIAKLPRMVEGKELEIADPELVYRLFGVLRTRSGQAIILFDDFLHCQATLLDCNKQVAKIRIEKVLENQALMPKITVCVGLTKKPAFEEIVYTCSALGVQTVVPVLSHQVERDWWGEKEFARLMRISITAREQAKSFAPTQILAPVKLNELSRLQSVNFCEAAKITFEKGAPRLKDFIANANASQDLILMFGPEAGLLDVELKGLVAQDFKTFGLCDNTLRTEDAVPVAVGLFRSLIF